MLLSDQISRKEVCHSDNLELTCPLHSQLSIIDANYGRLSSKACSKGRPASQVQNTNCKHSVALGAMETACKGKAQCSVTWATLHPGAHVDPCPGTFKYATVNYKCIGKLTYIKPSVDSKLQMYR